ncbi:MAG: acetate kinase [Candidatus Eisenbacteria bacterium]|nr:acetate kinase [Candidatus Eisenbacteria bacterium]
MNVLVLNCGSSSVRFQLIGPSSDEPLGKGHVERIGAADAVVTYRSRGKAGVRETSEVGDHGAALRMALANLLHDEQGAIATASEIGAVGHRVVHGGGIFQDAALITEYVIEGIRSCARFAPLHNPHNLRGIQVCAELLPGVPQVAVFDTAFHQTMPPEAYTYALPQDISRKLRIRRYGFHGTSHRFVAGLAAETLGRPLAELRLITCHLGNGASVTAVRGGVSVETSMGFTPLEGLVMGTRCGDMDPYVVLYLLENDGMSAADIGRLLNEQSGLLGLSGVSNDMRELLGEAELGNASARLAVDVFCHRVTKYIGAYAAVLGGADAVVFTGGIGEGSAAVREQICRGLEFLGIEVSPERNSAHGPNISVGTTPVLVVHTNEELAIARETRRVLSGG